MWAIRNLIGLLEEQECSTYLNAAGLPDEFLQTQVTNLSGGQRKRVAIARLLRQRAEILLADEPLASLDPGLSEQIIQLFLQTKEIKSSIVLVKLSIVF